MTAELPLAAARFDRSAVHRADAEWLAAAWTRSRVLVISPASSTPVRDGRLALRTPAEAPDGPRRFLGVVGDVPYFAVTSAPTDEQWSTLRDFAAAADDLDAGLFVCAVGLEQWHQRHPRCPRCGAPTVESQAGWTRTCTVDASEHFPRTDPAVIMMVHDGGDRALLGRGPQWNAGRFSTLAGFVEPGESLEAAVVREVGEEVGVAVTDVRYVASQPWPFPASLMVGFIARLDGDPSITLDPVEMAEAAWFTRAEIRQAVEWTDSGATPDPDCRLQGVSPKLSISRYLIDEWLAERI